MSRGPYPVMLMLAMALPGAVRALGLGEIRVDSGLNEPLSAQIDIVGATRDDLAALTAKVAGQDVFLRYGADRPSFLSSATFKVGLDARGRPVLNIRSADAFTDPVIDFLVDISWGRGELIREYSLLLDPPGFSPVPRTTEFAAAASAAAPRATTSTLTSTSAPASASASTLPSISTSTTASTAAPASASTQASISTSTTASTSAPTSDATRAAVTPRTTHAQNALPPAAVTGSQLRVAGGDTLRGIARRAGARSEADAQRLMVAIFRANPHAFEGNINLLHRGALLRIPSDSEVAAIDAMVATREVRAQTTAWRQDGKSAAQHPVAAAATSHGSARTAADEKSPAEALQLRVQSLEQALDAMHRELAAKDARIQDLKQLTAEPPASLPATSPPAASLSLPAVPLPAAALPPAPLPAAALGGAAPPAPSLPAVPLPATVHPNPAPIAGSPLHAELMQSQTHPAPVPAPVVLPPAPPLVDKAQLGSLAVALALLLGGFAYFRRRLARAGADLPQAPIAYVPPDTSAIERPEPQGPRPLVLPVAAPPALGQVQAEPAATVVAPDVTAVTAPVAVLAAALDPGHGAAPAARVAHQIPTHMQADDDTDYMGIDTQALERSYLDGLATDSMAVDTATHEAIPYDTANHEALPYDPSQHEALPDDTAKHEAVPYDTATHKAVPYDPSLVGHTASDPVVDESDLPTLMMEQPKTAARNADLALRESATLDFGPIDIDATAHHVHLSGDSHDQPLAPERRMNIVDVLESAIERDPRRRDLVLKLLETYYGAVSANQRAFLDVVRKLPRGLDFLNKDDWRKVEMMGRDIAPHDPLFAVDTQGNLLASFA